MVARVIGLDLLHKLITSGGMNVGTSSRHPDIEELFCGHRLQDRQTPFDRCEEATILAVGDIGTDALDVGDAALPMPSLLIWKCHDVVVHVDIDFGANIGDVNLRLLGGSHGSQ